jgi:putative peptide zinc metalloprotease protein
VNEAVAVNALCTACLTQALAMQLVLTLAAPPTPQQLDELAAIWRGLEAVADAVETVTFAETYAALIAVQESLIELFGPTATATVQEEATDGSPAPAGTEGPVASSGEEPSAASTAPTTTEAPSTSTTSPSTAPDGEGSTSSTTEGATTSTTQPSEGGSSTTVAP